MLGIGGDKHIVSLDWDRSALRAVHWRVGKSKFRLLKCVSVAIGPDVDIRDAFSLGTFLRRTLAQERIRTTAVIVDIPRDQAVLNTMSLPAVNLSDLAGMVQLQIAKELPFPLAQAVVDFAVSEHHGSGTSTDVLVAATRSEALEFYKAVCREAGLKLERVGLRPYANLVAVEEMLGARASGRVLLVDVGPVLTEVGIMRDGHMVFSRAASVPTIAEPDEPASALMTLETPPPAPGEDADATVPEPVAGDQEIINNLVVEITRSAEAYRSTDPGARFDHVIVAGSSGLEGRLVGALSQRFMVEARIYAPARLPMNKGVRGQDLTAFAAAIGLGLGHATGGRLHFDFLHPKRQMGARARQLRRLPLVGAGVAAVVLAAVVAYFADIHPKRQLIHDLDDQIAKLSAKANRYEDVKKKVQAVESWRARQLIWPDELLAFFEQLPPNEEAYLENLRLSRAGELQFDIVATGREVIDEFQNKLKKLVRGGTTAASGKDKSLFKVPANIQIINNGRDPRYLKRSKMVVVSARIAELDEKGKPK